jgi:hypothetical protein
VLLGGDLNTDLTNIRSSTTILVLKFMQDFDLLNCDGLIKLNINFTYFHEAQQQQSIIDYFIISNSAKDTVKEHAVISNLVNLSDHLPITVGLSVDLNACTNNPAPPVHVRPAVKPQSRLRWDHSNHQAYYDLTYAQLQPLSLEVDIFCNNIQNLRDPNYNCGYDQLFRSAYNISTERRNNFRNEISPFIETFYNRLTSILSDASDQTIPKMNSQTLKCWWNEELKALKETAMASHNAWVGAGRPRAGLIEECRKNDKYAYKLAIRRFKLLETKNINNSLFESLVNKDSTDFWRQWKSKLGSKTTLPKVVNGKTNEADIAAVFASSFAAACTSHSEQRSQELLNEFSMKRDSYYKNNNNLTDNVTVIGSELIDRSLAKLKLGKSAGFDKLTVEHIKFGHPIIIYLLARLFNLMLLIEYVPDGFGQGIMIPVPKGVPGAGADNTDNYRGISINPVISKIFEHCLLVIFNGFLNSHNRQFGFKAKSGCNHALYTVRKTVEFFIEREATVNVCAIDLAKAFDKMNRHALFIKLMARGCPMLLINILDCWLSKCCSCVRWGACLSSFIVIKTGTRQGAVLSPTVFAVFINDVIVRLENSSLGCYIRNMCMNAFLYADDLLLLSMTITDLEKMLLICKDEFDWLNIAVNVKKSACIRIGNRHNVNTANIYFDNKVIAWCKEFCYLGLTIVSAKIFKCNLHNAKLKFFRSINGILGKMGSKPNINVTLSLIAAHCNPVLFYGTESIRLNITQLNSLSYPFNSAYMKLFNSFNINVITACQFYCGQLPLEYAIDLRTLNFYSKLRFYDLNSPACILFKWLGEEEFANIAAKHGIINTDPFTLYNSKIWSTFENIASPYL